MQLKRGSRNLFKVSVEGELEGPLPLRVAGKASFEILWCDFSVKFNATLVDGGTPNDVILVDVLGVLLAALAEPQAVAGRSCRRRRASSSRSASRPTTGVLLHPLGTLTVRQTVVPLGLTRDIDRVGTGTPSGDRRFAVTRRIASARRRRTTDQRPRAVRARAVLRHERRRQARGAVVRVDGRGGDVRRGRLHGRRRRKASPFDYTDIVIGPDGTPGAAARAAVRSTGRACW